MIDSIKTKTMKMFSKQIKDYKVVALMIILLVAVSGQIKASSAENIKIPKATAITEQAMAATNNDNLVTEMNMVRPHAMPESSSVSEQPIELEKWMTDIKDDQWNLNEPALHLEEWMYDLSSWG